MPAPNCRYFDGYKPCPRSKDCSSQCLAFSPVQECVLIVHLGALGAVVRTTSILKALRRKHPHSFLIWVTQAPAHHLLRAHPEVDRVMILGFEAHQQLQALFIDAAYVIDKSLAATSFVENLNVKNIFGFKAQTKTGATLPATAAAAELWNLGLDNQTKFFVNKKPETQLLIEALELGPYKREPYQLPLQSDELQLKAERRKTWQQNTRQQIIGFNTGCAATIVAKRWTKEFQLQIIKKCLAEGLQNLVLLGGPEDLERNLWLAEQAPEVFFSPCDRGLRDGLCSVAACDIVVTGDSLGMHMAISQGVYTLVWFGPTVAAEIDLFDRGEKLITAMPCGPCWKTSCQLPQMCYDSFSVDYVYAAIDRGVSFCQKESLSSSPRSLAMQSSV